MGTVVINGVETEFKDLDPNEQKFWYIRDRKKFARDIINSPFSSMRKLVIDDKETSSDILKELFEIEIKKMESKSNIERLINHPNFEMNDDIIKKMANSKDPSKREIIAKYKRISSKILNQMLRATIKEDKYYYLPEIIFENPNFKMDNMTRKILAKSKDESQRERVAEDKGTSSNLLKEMLKAEIEGEEDDEVVNAILENNNFKMDDACKKLLAKSKDPANRRWIAEDEESASNLLKEMLKAEIEGEEDEMVVYAILNNDNFQMDDACKKLLAKSKDPANRRMIARDKESSSYFLKEMLKAEIEGEENVEVADAIIRNFNFEMDDEIREKLANSGASEYRKIAASDEGISIKLLEDMYLKEHDENVIKAIEYNIKKKRIIQKQQILKTLKESKDSEDFVKECLFRILEIL